MPRVYIRKELDYLFFSANKPLGKKYYLEKAFQFCERGKSAILLEAIHETKAKRFANIPQKLIRLEDSLKSEITFFEHQLANGRDQEKFKNLLFRYQSAYQDFISDLKITYPEYYLLKYDTDIVSVEKIQSSLEEDATLLSYFLGENEVFIFQISKNDFRSHKVPLSKDFESTANAFRDSMKSQKSETIILLAKKLHEQLIPRKLGKASKIIILPDGIIGILPFEAFIDPSSEGESFDTQDFLIERYSVSYGYSASLLVNRRTEYEAREEKILLCAPVNFQKNEKTISDLLETEKEVREIKFFFLANGDADVALKSDAHEGLIKSNSLTEYKYIHFATHGQVNESEPELSRILLSPSSGEDGSLYTGEIYNLKINADLVTLSACETGLGTIAKGKGNYWAEQSPAICWNSEFSSISLASFRPVYFQFNDEIL